MAEYIKRAKMNGERKDEGADNESLMECMV